MVMMVQFGKGLNLGYRIDWPVLYQTPFFHPIDLIFASCIVYAEILSCALVGVASNGRIPRHKH